MNKLIRLQNIRHYKNFWIEGAELVISKDAIESILPWDAGSLNDGHLLRIKNYAGLVESYVITREQFSTIVREFML